MSEESMFSAANIQPAPTQPAQVEELQAPGVDAPGPTAEQVRATDAVFSQQEESAAAGLLGAWSAGMLLNEIIGDHMGRAQEQEESRKKPKGDGPDGPPSP